jgi:predicted nucleic acid-binding protein
VIVADTSPLVFLARADLLGALPRLFEDVVLPPQVLRDAMADATRPGAAVVQAAVDAGLLRVASPTRAHEVARLSEAVDADEAAAIALALELGVRGLLIDDAAGRRLAEKEGLLPVGTLGVLVRCVRERIIDDGPARLAALEAAGLRMDEALRSRVLAAL